MHAAPSKPPRHTADLSGYPEMVVIYLGMRARSFGGFLSLLKLGPQIQASVKERPDGLLRHDGFLLGLLPLHLGMRQYWRDVGSMLAWTSALPHKVWWKEFLANTRGTTFWHETYFVSGGFESIFVNLPEGERDFGFSSFAPLVGAAPSTFSRFRKAERTAPPATDPSQP